MFEEPTSIASINQIAAMVGVPPEWVTAQPIAGDYVRWTITTPSGKTYHLKVTGMQLAAARHNDDAGVGILQLLRNEAGRVVGVMMEDGAIRCQGSLVEERQLLAAQAAMRRSDGLRDILTRPHYLSIIDDDDQPRDAAFSCASDGTVRALMVSKALALLSMLLGQAVEASRSHSDHQQLHLDLVQLAGAALALAAGVDPIGEVKRG